MASEFYLEYDLASISELGVFEGKVAIMCELYPMRFLTESEELSGPATTGPGDFRLRDNSSLQSKVNDEAD